MTVGFRNEGAASGSRFKLVLVQGGDGCDYTIGCGIRVEPLFGETMDEALVVAEARICAPDSGLLTSENAIELAFVADCEELPIAKWKAKAEEARANRKAAATEAKERAELERLKAKYASK